MHVTPRKDCGCSSRYGRTSTPGAPSTVSRRPPPHRDIDDRATQPGRLKALLAEFTATTRRATSGVAQPTAGECRCALALTLGSGTAHAQTRAMVYFTETNNRGTRSACNSSAATSRSWRRTTSATAATNRRGLLEAPL